MSQQEHNHDHDGNGKVDKPAGGRRTSNSITRQGGLEQWQVDKGPGAEGRQCNCDQEREYDKEGEEGEKKGKEYVDR